MKRFKNILCVVNTELKQNVALEHAVKLAESNQASITVVEVIDEIPANTKLLDRVLSAVNIQAKIVAEHEAKLEQLIAPWRKKIEIKSTVLSGIVFLEVIYEVLRNGHDLVFKVTDSGELLDCVFGSDDMHLLRKGPCPVWLVRPESPGSYQNILAAVDVDDLFIDDDRNTRQLLNIQILEMAGSSALLESSDLHVVHVWDAIGENLINKVFNDTSEDEVSTYIEEVRQKNKDNLDELMNKLIAHMGKDALKYIKFQKHLIKGYVRKEIPLFTKEINADLVIMGTVARTGIPGLFMGNTAESILNQLDCSVLAVKPQGFVTPVVLTE